MGVLIIVLFIVAYRFFARTESFQTGLAAAEKDLASKTAAMNKAKLAASSLKLKFDQAAVNLKKAKASNLSSRQKAFNTAKAAYDKAKLAADARTNEWEIANKKVEDIKMAVKSNSGTSFPSVGPPPNIATTPIGTLKTQVNNYQKAITKLMPEEEGFQSSAADVNDYIKKRLVYSTLQDAFADAKTVAKNAQDLSIIQKDTDAWKAAFQPLYQKICVDKLPNGNTLYEEQFDSLTMRSSSDCDPL
jgi:hypothetical protein